MKNTNIIVGAIDFAGPNRRDYSGFFGKDKVSEILKTVDIDFYNSLDIKSGMITKPRWIPLDGRKYWSSQDFMHSLTNYIVNDDLDNVFVSNALVKRLEKDYAKIKPECFVFSSFFILIINNKVDNDILSFINIEVDEDDVLSKVSKLLETDGFVLMNFSAGKVVN